VRWGREASLSFGMEPTSRPERSDARFLVSLPIRGGEFNYDEDDGAGVHAALRYVESVPVLCKLDPPREMPGRGLVSAFYCDGAYLFDNQERELLLSGVTLPAAALCKRAREFYGVCEPVDPGMVDSARQLVLDLINQLHRDEYEWRGDE